MRNFRCRPCAAVLVTAAFFFMADAAWIPAKAALAQALLERAWLRKQQGLADARPWPWADTAPVGVFEAPRLGVRLLVLDGASGRNLAFGPTALTPFSGNDLVLSGHRDTHFSFLERLEDGDLLRVTRVDGSVDFRVRWKEVVDSRARSLVVEPARQRLTLVTCYPFDAPLAGGPERLVITAVPAGGHG